MLPVIPYNNDVGRFSQSQFSGLDRRPGALNGAIRNMLNLSGDAAPLIRSRKTRYIVPWYRDVFVPPTHDTIWPMPDPQGMHIQSAEAIWTADSGKLYLNGWEVDGVELAFGETRFLQMGQRIIIWPDMLLINADQTVVPLAMTEERTATFTDGTYAGEPAEGNTIETAALDFDWSDYFNVGDAVTISGANVPEANKKTSIIREIDGNKLIFYENTWETTETAVNVTVSRTIPQMDFMCVNENRVWGCKDDTIYASKLGDPFNWNVFDGVSTDSYSVDTGTPGVFTACVSFMGYPCFFKEDKVFKVYGNRPTNFEVMGAATLGVLPEAYHTLAIAGETLFYLSRAGIVAYTGGMPAPIGAPLGDIPYFGGWAGSDGLRYYWSASYYDPENDLEPANEMLVYDTQTGQWHREDDLYARFFCYFSEGLALRFIAEVEEEQETRYYIMEYVTGINRVPVSTEYIRAEDPAPSMLEFSDWDVGSFGGKYPVRVWLRAEAEDGVTLTTYISYDGGNFEEADAWQPGGKRTEYHPVPIRRCDHWAIRLSSDGPFTLYAIEQELRVDGPARR